MHATIIISYIRHGILIQALYRLFYHSELLTDGFHGGADWQSCMAMQWMDNTRCWLVHVLNEAAVENSEEVR
jgi:hypothetical protein